MARFGRSFPLSTGFTRRQPFGSTSAVGQAVETDIAQPIRPARAYVVNLAVETDTAQAITAVDRITIGQALETDIAQATTHFKAVPVGQALETDIANSIMPTLLLGILVGQAQESDAAFSIMSVRAFTVGQALETDTAQPFGAQIVNLIDQALETDTAQPITSTLQPCQFRKHIVFNPFAEHVFDYVERPCVMLFIQDDPPYNPPERYLWIETGLGMSGDDFTFWFEDAQP